MHPGLLPSPFASEPFTVRDALDAGISARRIRASDLDSHLWGLRLRRAGRATTLDDRCRMLGLRVPNRAFFSHSTAAQLLGAPLPLQLERSRTLHVGVGAPAPRLHSGAIVGHKLAIDGRDVVVSRGIRHTNAARTWMDLSTELSLRDLVAVGDYLLYWRMPLTTHAELRARVAAVSGQRGILLARAAVELLGDRSESRRESHLRLILILGGLPEPLINHTIIDTETGKNVRPDFLFPAEKLILEYQGDYHRTAAQWRKDMTRRSRLEADGWYVMELNVDDLRNPTELMARINGVLSRRAR